MSEENKPYDEVTTGQEKPVKKGIVEEIQEMKERGEINTAAYKEKIKQLEVILGVKELSPFGTNELDIFEDNLKSMNLTDMMRMAQKAGLNPHQDRPRLKASLLKEWMLILINLMFIGILVLRENLEKLIGTMQLILLKRQLQWWIQ